MTNLKNKDKLWHQEIKREQTNGWFQSTPTCRNRYRRMTCGVRHCLTLEQLLEPER